MVEAGIFKFHDADRNIFSIPQKEGKPIIIHNMCLLNMHAKSTLQPEDGQTFDGFLFGGILGDHPPQRRTQMLEKEWLQ